VSTGAETVLTVNTDYTVTLNGNQDSNPGGNVILPAVLASGYTLTISSDIANLQPTDLTNQGGFYPEVITDALDRATIQIQQMSEDVGRSLKAPFSDGLPNMELPNSTNRASKYLVFDANGLPTVSSGSGTDTALRTDLANQTVALAGASLVGFRANNASSVGRTVLSKLRDTFNIMDYVQGNWTPNDVTKDFTPTFAAAIAAVAAAGGGVLEFVGKDNYYFLTRPPEISGQVCLDGKRCVIWKYYIETGTGTYAGAEGQNRGVFSFDGYLNNNTFIRDFSIINAAWDGSDDTGNGSAISIVADVGDPTGPGLIWISNIHVTANATALASPANYIWWKSCIYINGSEQRTGAIGVRGVWIDNCTLFCPATAAIEAYAVEHLYVSNTESNVGRTNCCGVKIDGGLKSGGVGAQSDRPNFSNCDFQSVFGYKIGTESSTTHSYVESPVVMGTIGQLELGAQALTPLLVGSQTNTKTLNTSNYTLLTETETHINGGLEVGSGTESYTATGTITAAARIVSIGSNVTGMVSPTGSTAWRIACVGATDIGISTAATIPAGQSVRFDSGSAKLMSILLATGDACLAFADYKSATVSLLSNPSSTFTNATGTANRISITKSANSHTIRVMNEFSTSQNVSICFVGSTPGNLSLGV
jgi:hypothetical protein